jgi:uncharacterized LabA/DUF88 family protein
MFNKYPEKIAVIVDGSNLYFHALTLGLRIDFIRFKQFFEKRGNFLAYMGYYTAIHEEGSGRKNIQPFVDMLGHNGYTVVNKPAKEFATDELGRSKIKGNMDVEICVDAIEVAGRVDHVYLVTGDGDFTYLVRAIQSKATKVTVVSSIRQNMLSNELRKAANHVLDLVDIAKDICITLS